MALSDSQIMLLEQLTYLNDGIYKEAGTAKTDNPKTVADIIAAFQDGEGNLVLGELDGSKETGSGLIPYEEWAAIIRGIAEDPQLMELSVGPSYSDEDGATLATAYQAPGGEAYVTFRGTTGSREWHDNVLGLYQSDTACQQEALAYIESLPYDNITVSGHSKGGNKAMYVALLSDKVNRCISMDGQGFSKEFYEKYWAEVQKKGGCITNYSLDDDYVHILLSPVPGSEQVYCHGYNAGGADNHSPNAYFDHYKDEDGDTHIKVQEGGSYYVPVPENPGLSYLHDFTVFAVNVMPYEDRKYLAEYLGIILAVLMEGYYKDANGNVYTKDNLQEFILSDKDAIAKLLAYVIKYVETYDLTMDNLRALLEGFGMEQLADDIEALLNDLPFDIDGEEAFNWLIRKIGENLGDGGDDWFIKWLLEKLAGKYADEYGIDINDIWGRIEDEYMDIPNFDPNTANNNLQTKSGKVRNFSRVTYDVLMEAINTFQNIKIDEVGAWNAYKSEDWFGGLLVSLAVKAINLYAEHISNLNAECKIRVDRVFSDVDQADAKNAAALCLHNDFLVEECQQLRNTSNRINPYITTP